MKPGLTGRTRYRQQTIGGWFSKQTVLVLQVEEIVTRDTFTPVSIDTEQVVIWRDATISDLTVVGPADVAIAA